MRPISWSIILEILDVLLVAYVFYRLMLLIRGTRAIELLKGILMLFIAFILSAQFQLDTINWILRSVMTVLVIALPVVFQPELRRALEQLGRGKFFGKSKFHLERSVLAKIIPALTEAAQYFSDNRIGALIVIEREVGLKDYEESGIFLDAEVKSELLISIFMPNTPLHDGAVLIRQDRLVAAGCFLPLSGNRQLSPKFGTRHRAAVGVSEESDALIIVVSEETGIISLVSEGRMIRYLDENSLLEQLFKYLAADLAVEQEPRFSFKRRKRK